MNVSWSYILYVRFHHTKRRSDLFFEYTIQYFTVCTPDILSSSEPLK